jgi:hypothetical protein
MRKNKNRRPSHPKRRIFWLVLVLILLTLGITLKTYFDFRQSSLDSLGRVSLILLTSQNEPLVLSLEGREGKVLALAGSEKVNVPRGFGEYELAKVYALGELEEKGAQLLRETVEEKLSVPIFGYLHPSWSIKESDWEKPKTFLKKVFWEALWGRVKTDLKRGDLFRLYWQAISLDETLCRVPELKNIPANFFQDRRLREEGLSLEILNATDHNGLAQQASRLLEKAGGRVVRLGDVDKNVEHCQLLTKDEAESYTVFWLAKVFQCSFKKEEATTARGDIVLILGEEYWKRGSERW